MPSVLRRSRPKTLPEASGHHKPLQWHPSIARPLTHLLTAVLLIVTIVPEFGDEMLETLHVESHYPWARFFDAAFWYQPLLRAGNHTPRNRFVRVITLGDSTEPAEIFANLCQQRLFMARLLDRLQLASPSIIVIDKYFLAGACPDPADPGTRMLRASLSRSAIPIVVGLGTLDERHFRATGELNSAEATALERGSLVLEEHASLSNDGGNVRYGLIRLNHDNRKIPLEWPTYGSRQELAAQAPRMLPTLARVAAELRDPGLRTESKYMAVLARHMHPYTGFLPRREIVAFHAMHILCGPNASRVDDWRRCVSRDPVAKDMRGYVVVIGNTSDDRDLHPSVIGTVPGVFLQANYIESLLDDRFLKPVPTIWNIGINLSTVILIGVLFLGARREQRTRSRLLSFHTAAIAGLFLCFALWILSYVTALHLDYYLPVWFPGLYVIGLWADSWLEHARARRGYHPAGGGVT